MIELVIKIPDRYTKMIGFTTPELEVIATAVLHGTPLPKGHGRLIDADKAIKSLYDFISNKKTIGQCIDDTPTVIEADKDGEE